MKVSLGHFACTGIEAQIGGDIPAGARRAVLRYVDRVRAGRRPVSLPDFLGELEPPAPGFSFDLSVDAETEALLEREALRQQTTIERLVAYAVLAFIAEEEILGVPRC
jgi:hypothetical protein